MPRPIAFVSSLDGSGTRNLAPFSYFTLCSSNPPYVVFSPVHRGPGLAPKDTLRNVQETGEFVVNIVSEDILSQMNATAADYPPEIDEFAVSGLTPVASDRVKPPRVKESRVQLECVLKDIVVLSDKPGGGSLVIGEIVLMHIDRDILADPASNLFKVDPKKLNAVGRMGGPTYTRTHDLIHLERPRWRPK
ncbi:MAG: flavin reductase family protein [Acidobacteriota bacterium]|nr:flavin reductase family protein [Acidobacteriota bacterium]